MKYQEIIIKLGEAYYRASAIDMMGTGENGDLLLILNGIAVNTGTPQSLASTARALIATLMTRKIPDELNKRGVTVVSRNGFPQMDEALVDLNAYFASKEAP